jgi:hypothetical protein
MGWYSGHIKGCKHNPNLVGDLKVESMTETHCHECKTWYTLPKDLRRHQLEKHSALRLRCQFCNYEVGPKRQSNLIRHMKAKHSRARTPLLPKEPSPSSHPAEILAKKPK